MEYGLIISVVSIAAVVLIMAMGPRVASMFSSAAAGFPSDRRRKGGFKVVNQRELLEQVAVLPIGLWSYQDQQPGLRHIGPTAEDFRSAFGVGDEADLPLVDANGVALTAIQGLHLDLDETRRRLGTLSARISAVEAAMGIATQPPRSLPKA